MSEITKAKHTLNRNAERATGIWDEAKDKLADLADDAKEKGDELLSEVRESGNKAWDNVQDQGDEVWKGIKRFVSKNPGPSIGWAAVAGAVLYAILTRKDD